MARVDVNVAVDDEHSASLPRTAAELAARGLVVTATLDQLGVVLGSADPDRLDALRAVEGVLSVEAARDVGVGPPDAPVQ